MRHLSMLTIAYHCLLLLNIVGITIQKREDDKKKRYSTSSAANDDDSDDDDDDEDEDADAHKVPPCSTARC